MAAISAGALAAIGAGTGLAAGAGKYAMDKNAADRQRKLAGATERNSPWTGMHAQPVQEANLFGDLSGGAMTGLSMGSQIGALRGAPLPSLDGATMTAGGVGDNLGKQLPGQSTWPMLSGKTPNMYT